jgi:hypothetical protein
MLRDFRQYRAMNWFRAYLVIETCPTEHEATWRIQPEAFVPGFS